MNVIMINSFVIRVPLVRPLSFPKTLLKLKCCVKNSDENDFKDKLSGVMGEQVEQLLSRQENKGLMDNLQKASQRVEIAKTQLAFIQKQELALKQFKDYTQQLQGNASQVLSLIQFNQLNSINLD